MANDISKSENINYREVRATIIKIANQEHWLCLETNLQTRLVAPCHSWIDFYD